MRSVLDPAIVRLASGQSDAFSREQLLALGVHDSLIHRRVSDGRWTKVHPGVFRLPGASHGWLGDLWAARLAVGPIAVVSHESAAQLHGLRNCATGLLTFTVPHGGHPRIKGAVVHQLRDHPTSWQLRHESGLHVTTVERTLVDLAATTSHARLDKVVEEAILDRRLTWLTLAHALGQIARPGKPGIKKMARILDAHVGGRAVSQSVLERVLLEVLEAGALPMPIVQFVHPAGAALPGCVDAAFVAEQLIVETDGRRWHTRIADLARDHERDSLAAREGWQTLRFLHEHLIGDPGSVAATVREVLRVRGSFLAA